MANNVVTGMSCVRPRSGRVRSDSNGAVAVGRVRRPRGGGPVMGWGACCVSGCPCQAFQQTYGSELCGNCGHKYTDHS